MGTQVRAVGGAATLMPSFLVPLHEFNTCHTPAGSSAGGQFCGDEDVADPGPDDYQQGYPDVQASALGSARSAMLRASFESDAVRETMSVVDAKGVYVGPMLTGDEQSIEVSEAVWRPWVTRGPVVTAHTHPGSSTFSIDDFILHNKINRAGEADRRGMTVTAMQVYGEDGSWYELKFERVFNRIPHLQAAFELKRNLASRAATDQTTRWAKTQPWWASRPPKTWELMTDEEHIRHAAEKAGALQSLDRQHARHFRDHSQHIWASLAAQFGGFTYRYHLAD